MSAPRSARRALGLALLAAGLAAGAAPAAAQTVFTNPVLKRPQGVADPHILKYNGEYYLYATGDPIRGYHSTDLVTWEEMGPMVGSSKAPSAWNQADVWAPEVVYRNGKFYLYYTAAKASPDWRVGEMTRRIGVAVSDSPRGPFVDLGAPLTPGWGIDGHLFRDPDSGEDFFFYSYLDEPHPRHPGAGMVVDRMLDLTTLAGRPSRVSVGSEAWEDKDADPNNGSLRYTNEGPTVVKRNGLYYVMYSGGSWDLPTYSMGYAVSDRVMEGGLGGSGWAKVVPPMLRSTQWVQAPGHNTLIKAPNNLDDITAYHARVVPFRGPGDRQTFLDRLYWTGDRMHMQQPTLGALPAPDRPVFGDLFNRSAATLGPAWEVLSGGWRVDGTQAVARTGAALAVPRADRLAHYLFEANVRLPRGSSRGAVGVAAYYRDRNDRVDVWLDAGRRALVSAGTLNGAPVAEQVTRLDPEFRFDAYHQILVTKNGRQLTVALDGVDVQRRELPMREGTAGIQTRGTGAEFDGVALTAAYEDHFAGPAHGWESRGGEWVVEEGALHQVAGGAGRYVALKGDAATDYEFTGTLLWRDNESTESKAGVVAAATPEGEMVLAGFHRTIWPFARFFVQHVQGGQVRQTLAVEMPRGFQYDVPHTIRAVKQGNGFSFFLDGDEIAAARFSVGEARPGLFTEGVRAGFGEARMKHLVVPQNLVLDGGFEAERGEEGPATPAAAWQLAGRAMYNMCCAHSGIHRLLLAGRDDAAAQTVTGLAPGRYSLWAWATTRDAEAEVRVAAGGAERRATATGGEWRRVQVDFEVPPGQDSATIHLGGRFGGGGEGLVAIDDVFLFRR